MSTTSAAVPLTRISTTFVDIIILCIIDIGIVHECIIDIGMLTDDGG